MPSVFSDAGSGNYDLTITTSADWTISTGNMPNGDNSAALNTTLNSNAEWAGEEFCLPSTAGSDARTLEFWAKITAVTNRVVAIVRTNGTATTGTNVHWEVLIQTNNQFYAEWKNTGGTSYLIAGPSAATQLNASGAWNHVVIIWNCGSSKSCAVWLNNALAVTSTTTSGTPTTASSDSYIFYLGAGRRANSLEMNDPFAKVAWYSRALTSGEISDHYLAMTAT